MLPFDSEQNEMFAIPRSAWNAVQEEHEMLYARCLALEKKLHELGQESIDIHGAKRKPLTLAQSLALQFRLVANHCFPSDFQFVLAGYGQLSQERNGHHVIQALFLNLLRCPEKHNAGLQATLEEHSQAILYDSLAKGGKCGWQYRTCIWFLEYAMLSRINGIDEQFARDAFLLWQPHLAEMMSTSPLHFLWQAAFDCLASLSEVNSIGGDFWLSAMGHFFDCASAMLQESRTIMKGSDMTRFCIVRCLDFFEKHPDNELTRRHKWKFYTQDVLRRIPAYVGGKNVCMMLARRLFECADGKRKAAMQKVTPTIWKIHAANCSRFEFSLLKSEHLPMWLPRYQS